MLSNKCGERPAANVPPWLDTGYHLFCIAPQGAGELLRQYRTEIAAQMRSQIFRQIVPKFCRNTRVFQKILVQYDGKYASRCAAKASAALCAVLP